MRLFEPAPVYFRCRCSRERVGGMLQDWAKRKPARCSRSAARSKCAAISATAPTCSMRSMSEHVQCRRRERQRRLGSLGTGSRGAAALGSRAMATCCAAAVCALAWAAEGVQGAAAPRRPSTRIPSRSRPPRGAERPRPRAVLRSALVGVRQDRLRHAATIRAHAFGPPNDLPVQRGGRTDARGVRAVPSLMYAQNVPPFTEHYVDDEGDDSIDQGPAGGRTWDGRAQSAHEQARLPLFSPFEMANAERGRRGRARCGARATRRSFATRSASSVRRSGSGVQRRAAGARDLSAEPGGVLSVQQQVRCMAAPRSVAERRGDARAGGIQRSGKGNCARCHPSAMQAGAFPQFTDFGYAASACRATRRFPPTRTQATYDLGLCGPLRTDLDGQEAVLRHVPHAVAAQRGDARSVLPQRRVASSGRCGALLCRARHAAAEVVSTRQDGAW